MNDAHLQQLGEALLITRGETEAMRRLLAALIRTHPDPPALLAALESETLGLHRHWEKFPDQGPARFRAEELLESWMSMLRAR